MSEGKRQSVIVAGIGLVLIGCIILYFSLSQPKIYIEKSNDVTEDAVLSASGDNSYDSPSLESSADVSLPLNLNTCTAQELMEIEGVGESRAKAIIEYREYLGEYSSVDEIKNIKGIGDSLYSRMAPYLYV